MVELQGAPPHYELVIAGGTVIDPACGVHAVCDVGIRKGRIAAVSVALDARGARRVVDATGKFVLPGLVDMHLHVFEHAWNMGEDTDRICRASGVTTICDAGSTGSTNFRGMRNLIDRAVRTKMKVFVNVSAFGIMGGPRGGELRLEGFADVEGCVQTIAENPDLAVGVKLRYQRGLVWEDGVGPLRVARQAADLADAPLMVHVTDSPVSLPRILDFMRPGDIVSHCYHGYEHGIMGPQQARILPEVRAAQAAGVVFECAHGRAGHFNFPIARRAMEQGFMTDVISTDLTLGSALHGPVYDLPTTMTKLLHLGMSLDEVVARATHRPAQVLSLDPTVGTLRVGAAADIAVFSLEAGAFELPDTDGNTIVAERRLVTELTVTEGRETYKRPLTI